MAGATRPGFADVTSLLPLTRTALRGHQPQICSCLFSLRKAARLVERGDEARRRHRADPRHRAQTSDYFVAIGELGELLVRPLDLL